jgi:hypothetical protein
MMHFIYTIVELWSWTVTSLLKNMYHLWIYREIVRFIYWLNQRVYKKCRGNGLDFNFHNFQSSPKLQKILKFWWNFTKSFLYFCQILALAEIIKIHEIWRILAKIRNLACGVPCDKIPATPSLDKIFYLWRPIFIIIRLIVKYMSKNSAYPNCNSKSQVWTNGSKHERPHDEMNSNQHCLLVRSIRACLGISGMNGNEGY